MMNQSVTENLFLEKLTAGFLRSPLQKNKLNHSDAEIISIPNITGCSLAITVDSIVEEIEAGLYNDPYLIGWMTVMVNMSDLAAVGAEPLGILISEVIPTNYPETSLVNLQRGIQDACSILGTFVLGGDTNFSDRLMLTGCAIGKLEDQQILSRIGCAVGDILYTSNLLGSGNAFAFRKMFSKSNSKLDYRPIARVKEGRLFHTIATACMDTSDGVIATLDQLMQLNDIGFLLDDNWESHLHLDVIALGETMNISTWLFLAGCHGEFELLFTIPEKAEEDFLDRANAVGWRPLRLGRAIDKQGLFLPLYDTTIEINTRKIRNIIHTINGDFSLYLTELLNLDNELKEGVKRYAQS